MVLHWVRMSTEETIQHDGDYHQTMDEATWFAVQAVTIWEKENTLDERDARDKCRD